MFVERLRFPANREEVIERVGDVALDPPDGDRTTVEAVLEMADDTEFHSPDELHQTVVGYVGDGFIGRKYYDDRGGQPQNQTDQRSF